MGEHVQHFENLRLIGEWEAGLTPGASLDLRMVCSSLSRMDSVQSLGGSSWKPLYQGERSHSDRTPHIRRTSAGLPQIT